MIFINRNTYLLLLLILCVLSASAQNKPSNIKQVIAIANNYNDSTAAEHLYLHTDKPAYNTGDTLWFKAYLLNAAYLNASAKSGVLYVEVANDSNRVMKRIMLPVYMGIAAGHIALDAGGYAQGGYTLRGYTSWMRNLGEATFFKKHFYISENKGTDWLVNYNLALTKQAEKENIALSLQVKQMDNSLVMLRPMQLRLTDGRRTWFKSTVETNLNGALNVNFNLPEKANSQNLSISMQDASKGGDGHKILLPLLLNRAQNIDLQFMPEGGKMVAGLPTLVAFKALSEDGLGCDIAGNIVNNKAEVVASFKSTHKGMGTFALLPQLGEVYTAAVKLPNGSTKTYTLPAVAPKGVTLSVRNPFKSDTCHLRIMATPDVAAAGGTFYLLGIARGVICYGASLRATGLNTDVKISRTVFPSGTVRFVITDSERNILSERMAYIENNDNLHITLTPQKKYFTQRDSATLEILATNNAGKPVQGSFSVAVTDDSQVRADSLTRGSIATYMQLTANLAGHVEDPGYYAGANLSAVKWQHLDQLLLTQGWVGYNWADAFKPVTPPTYPAEAEPSVSGRITNMFNKPVAGSGVTLFSKKPSFVTDTVSNALGIFTFKSIPTSDTAVYFIQARNKRGKSFNVGIEMNDFTAPAFTTPAQRTIPWFANTDSSNFAFVKKQLYLKTEQQRISRGTLLKAVEVKAKKIIKESKNLNGPGEADIVIDEKALEKAGRMSLGDLLRQNVKGFAPIFHKGSMVYMVNFMAVKIIIDGIDVEFTKPDGISIYEHLKQYLDYYDAEEIKGIELMTNPGHQSSYDSQFLPPMAQRWAHVYVEVTTRSGGGPFVKKAVGTYVYRPMPFQPYKQFYAPRYSTATTADMTDIRSTVFWAPNVITDQNGKATVSFYTADITGSYTVIIEGADLNGALGSQTGKMYLKRAL